MNEYRSFKFTVWKPWVLGPFRRYSGRNCIKTKSKLNDGFELVEMQIGVYDGDR